MNVAHSALCQETLPQPGNRAWSAAHLEWSQAPGAAHGAARSPRHGPERQARRQTSRWHCLSALRAKTCFTAGLQNHSIGDHTVADMKTSLTDEQLADPAIAEADRILNTCQHFGFCTAGCPTYALLHDENDGPRGRIDLIKEMLESQRAPTPRTVAHIDRCLSCMSCMTTCAVKVDYMHLVDTARAHIEENYRRPPGQRIVRGLLGLVLPRPALFRMALALGRLARPFRRRCHPPCAAHCA